MDMWKDIVEKKKLQLRNNGVHIDENVIVMTFSYKVNYKYIKPSYSLVYLIKCRHFLYYNEYRLNC